MRVDANNFLHFNFLIQETILQLKDHNELHKEHKEANSHLIRELCELL